MPKSTLEQQANGVRYCNSCDYVIPADVHILQQYHVSSCQNWLAGYDCMHMEGKICCECDAA